MRSASGLPMETRTIIAKSLSILFQQNSNVSNAKQYYRLELQLQVAAINTFHL